MKDDLVEQVSATIKRLTRAHAPATPEELARAILAIARPAILEEAAKVASRHDAKPCGHTSGWSEDQRQMYDGGQIDASTSIAAAIRALAHTTGQEGGRWQS